MSGTIHLPTGHLPCLIPLEEQSSELIALWHSLGLGLATVFVRGVRKCSPATATPPEIEPERLPLVCVWFYLDVDERFPHKAFASVGAGKQAENALRHVFEPVHTRAISWIVPSRNQVTSVSSQAFSSVKENETMKPPF